MVQRVKKPPRLTSNKGTMLATGSNTNSRLEPVLGPVLGPVLEPVLEPVLAPCKRGLRAAGFRAAGLLAQTTGTVNGARSLSGAQRLTAQLDRLDKLSLLVGFLYVSCLDYFKSCLILRN